MNEIESSSFASERLLAEIKKLKAEIKEKEAALAHREEENNFLRAVIKRLTVF
tara:strand:- start:267 stop:425 length:159 start_codon:yes stop_codon:yes gene_type:complete